LHSRRSTQPPNILEQLDSRLNDLGDLEAGDRFMVPGIGRSGVVLAVDDDSSDDQVLVELEGSRARLRSSLRVQLVPDPPAEPL
jgi:hypothetical protein